MTHKNRLVSSCKPRWVAVYVRLRDRRQSILGPLAFGCHALGLQIDWEVDVLDMHVSDGHVPTVARTAA